jgi:predicted branched-subunit amino acid permease
VLTDQAYALSVARWAEGADRVGRLSDYLGAGWLLWASWQASTVAGVLVGGAIPDEVPLDFAVPLVFLVLLIPLVRTAPAVIAAVTGGVAAVATGEMGGETVSIIVGALAGIAAGSVADAVTERSRAASP